MNINEIDIKKIKPYENNPRNNSAAIDAVANSIKEFGFKVPIVVDKNNVIVAGHTRLKAAEKLGLEKVPVIVADDLSPEQVQAFRLADNKTAELAEWDFDKLEKELNEIEMEMSQFGFDFSDVKMDFDEVVEDEVPEVDEENEPITKLGDVYKLGNHILICGDSTDKETVDLLMRGGGKKQSY